MDRQHVAAGAGNFAEQFAPRLRGLLLVPIENGRPVRLAHLQGVMHEVADHDRVAAARADVDTAMAWRMAGRRGEGEGVVERIIVIDQQRLAGGDDWLAIIAPDVAAAAGPVLAALV